MNPRLKPSNDVTPSLPVIEPEPSEIPLSARSFAAPPEAAVGEFMVMPAGVQSINCGQSGKDISVTVQVDRSSAAALEQQRAALAARGAHRPYFDFDHDDKQASFWPAQFFWSDSPAPGVYVRGEWSEAGRAAVEGRTYRAFSPRFHVDSPRKNPAKVICYEQASLNMGGLVNDPAFRNNLPLWAKRAVRSKEEICAHEAKIGALEAKGAELTLALRAQHLQEVEAALTRAIRRGAIPVRDFELQAKWRAMVIDDPACVEFLDAIPGSPALMLSSQRKS